MFISCAGMSCGINVVCDLSKGRRELLSLACSAVLSVNSFERDVSSQKDIVNCGG